jgi:hypothetical protein
MTNMEKKISKKKESQPPLTFQTRDSGHQTGSTLHAKIIKPNPQEIKCLKKKKINNIKAFKKK